MAYTRYHMKVHADALPGALERLGAMLTAPLLAADRYDKPLSALQQPAEHTSLLPFVLYSPTPLPPPLPVHCIAQAGSLFQPLHCAPHTPPPPAPPRPLRPSPPPLPPSLHYILCSPLLPPPSTLPPPLHCILCSPADNSVWRVKWRTFTPSTAATPTATLASCCSCAAAWELRRTVTFPPAAWPLFVMLLEQPELTLGLCCDACGTCTTLRRQRPLRLLVPRSQPSCCAGWRMPLAKCGVVATPLPPPLLLVAPAVLVLQQQRHRAN